MKISVDFMLAQFPDSARHADITMESGATVRELIEECIKLPEVIISAEVLLGANCIVNGVYLDADGVLEGDNKDVIFLTIIEGG